jgi:hypothetical protein
MLFWDLARLRELAPKRLDLAAEALVLLTGDGGV